MRIVPATETGWRGMRGRWRAAALATICAAAIWCYAPALRAYFAQDDFTLLEIARLLREPWLLFVRDHFPGSLFFRPLGIFVWWLTAAWFDNAPRGHYAVNLLLHLGCVFALYAVLQRLRRGASINLAWTAVYAVHPLAIGTALWLSDRFDLIATAFSLLAMNFALQYRRQPRAAILGGCMACVLVAFTGKETAIVGAAAVAVLLAVPDGEARLSWRERWRAVAAVVLLAAGWLAYRHALLTNPQTLLLQPGELVATFAKGIGLWLRIGFEYLAFDPRQATWMHVVLACAAALLAWAIVAQGRCRIRQPHAWGIGAALLILIFLPGPTQAPVVAVSTRDLGANTFWFDLIGESRLYHLSLAGLIAALMLLTTPRAGASAAPARVSRPEWLALAALLPMLAVWAVASHGIAHDYAKRTRQQIAPLQAAHAAIARLALPEHHCQIYLLDTAPLWGFDGVVDPIIKATASPAERLAHCLIMTERTAWANYVRAGSFGPEDYRPQRPLTWHGQPVPWLVLGGLEAVYLNLDADIDARTIDGAFFLEYRDGRFVDVTSAVHDGTRPVHFFNARPDRY
jgi:hypothetical protein